MQLPCAPTAVHRMRSPCWTPATANQILHPLHTRSFPDTLLPINQHSCDSQVIRDLLDVHKFVIVVEHDLSVLDYLSDFICCLYGKPGAYGVVTLPFGVR